MSGKMKNAERLIYILIAVLLAFVFKKASASHYNAEGFFHGFNYNLLVYVSALAGAFAVYLILMGLADHFSRTPVWDDIPNPEEKGGRNLLRRILYIVYIAAAASVLILVYQIYAHENSLYPENTAATYLRQEIPHPVYFGIIAALSLVLFFGLRQESEKDRTFMRFGLMPIFAFFSAALVWCPNILKDTGAGSLHIHAVTNSIVNIMHGAPYSDLNCSIYGHYSLFLGPLSMLLGNNLQGIMLSLSVSAFAAFMAAFYAAHKMIRSNVVYFLALCGITGTTTLLTRRGQYFQVNPLRLLWPAVTIALVAYAISNTQTRKRRRIAILEILVGSCALIWNFETGVFCVLVLMASRVFRALFTDPLFSRHTLMTALKALLYGLLCALIAFCTVGIYSVACGGSFGTVKQFVYPLFSSTYHVNNLRHELPSVTYLYFFEILVFLLTIFICLRRQAKHLAEDSAAETAAFATGLSGLLSLIYFMNRAVYGNMSISHIQFVLLLGFWSSKALIRGSETIKEQISSPSSLFNRMLVGILFGCSVLLAVEGASYIQIAADFRVKSSWNTKSLEQAAADLMAAVPENTYGFGTYVPELYAMLGWDTDCYMTDWSDINGRNRKYALDGAFSREAFVTSEEIEAPGYRVSAEIPVGEYTFRYFQKE